MSTHITKSNLQVQVIRHYVVVLMRFSMAVLFGVYLDPTEMGEFITISFSCTFCWVLVDFGFKDRALQVPFNLDLSALKSVQSGIGLIISLLIFSFAFCLKSLSENQFYYLISYALSTLFVATASTSYIKSYWEKRIVLLAKTDLITHLILQPIALFLLIKGNFALALICSFIFPQILHALILLFKQSIPFTFQFNSLLSHWKPSLLLGLNQSLSQIKSKADTLLLASVSSPTFVGLYNRGYALPHHANQFIQAVIEPLFIPDLAQKKRLNFSKYPLFILILSSLLIPLYFIIDAGVSTFWLESWSLLLPALPFFIIWGFAQLLLGLHETILKAKALNSYLVFRQCAHIGMLFTCILLFHSNLKELSFSIASCLSVLCVTESIFILYKKFDSSILTPISVCVAFSLLLIVAWYL